jgi:hypothetical protein
MKAKTLLVAAVMVLGLSAVAYAQATFTVGSVPVTAVTATGLTEKTGDLTFTIVSGTTVAGTITITYPVPITNTLAAPPIVFGGTAGGVITVNASSNNGATTGMGQLVVDVPVGIPSGFFFTISGVRVSASGSGLSVMDVSISAVGNAITAGQTVARVITSIQQGIIAGTSATVTMNGVTGAATGTAALSVRENYLNAFGVTALTDTTQNLATAVRFQLMAAPPPGVSVVFPGGPIATTGTGATGAFSLVDSSGAPLASQTITSASTSLDVYYMLTTDSSPTAIETLTVNPAISFTGTSSQLPVPAGMLSYQSTLALNGTAFCSGAVCTAMPAGAIPRYAVSWIPGGTILTVQASKTVMLVPFAVAMGNYDTGFAIANTSVDPGTSNMGVTTAVPQSGSVTFYLYGQVPAGGTTTPAVITKATGAGAPGTGLDANGLIPAGSTYTVLLSEILAWAGAPAEFQGYVFIVTGFTNGHAQYTISDFSDYTSASQAMIIVGARNATPEANNH